jgi:hypothetical protein
MTDEKRFFELGKRMYERLNPQIGFRPKVVGPVQEPVAWMVYTEDGQSVYVTDNPTDIQAGQRALPLYTSPPKREWVNLTDDDIKEIIGSWGDTPIKGYIRKLMDQIQDKLKEKNT